MMRNFFGSATGGKRTRENEIQVQVIVIDAPRVNSERGVSWRPIGRVTRDAREQRHKLNRNQTKPNELVCRRVNTRGQGL